MNNWLTQVKREFWEHQSMFVIMPLIVAGLVVVAGIYMVIFEASPESEISMGLFGHAFHQEAATVNETGENIDFSAVEPAEVTVRGEMNEAPVEYIIDFSTGELKVVEDTGPRGPRPGDAINATLYGIHSLFYFITAFVLLFYQLSCLHTDRKDRSVLFWKSMPVSETRNVATKLIIAVPAVPLLVTVISWVVQISYLFLSMIFIYRLGSDQWTEAWSQVELLPVFIEEVKLVLWLGAWFLPFSAWWLFASALARRSPFLVATIPFVVAIILENLLFGSWSIGLLLLDHLDAGRIQLENITGNELIDGAGPGSVDFFFNNTEMIAGIIIAGLLFPATVWLRNHRFEI